MDKRLADYLVNLGADARSLIGWTVHVAQSNGEDCGFVITRGPEIHILPLMPGCSITRRNIMEHLGCLIDRFGYATTRVPIAETDHRLRTALGFEQTWSDKNCTYWAITKLKYARTQQGESPCL